MKKIVFGLLTLTILSFVTFSQEKTYFLSKGIAVGCPGADPMTDMSKKAVVNFKGETGVLTLKSIYCSQSIEFSNISNILNETNTIFTERNSGLGMIFTENTEIIIYINKLDGVQILATGNENKKLAKKLTESSAKEIVNNKFDKIKGGLEEFEKKKKEEELAKNKKEEEERMRKDAENKAAEMGDFYAKNKGKILFTEKKLNQDHSRDDKDGDFITEFELGASSIYARAFYNEPRLNKMLNIKFSIGDVSVSSEQLRDEHGRNKNSRYMGGVASASYWSSEFIGHFPMVSATGGYYGAMNSMAEDAFRILLSNVAASLTRGSTHTVKVEVAYAKDIFDHSEPAFMSGEIKMKITEKSENLLSLLCRCTQPAKKDAAVEKEVKELFLSDPNITAVHSVSLLQNDYKIVYQAGNPVSRNIEVQVIFTNTYGWNVVWKGTVTFNYEGTKYSEKANWGKNTLYIPVSPTCVKGIK